MFNAGNQTETSTGDASPATDDQPSEDLRCLQCFYCLRGLPGDPVRCPECGQESSLAELREFAADLSSDELRPVDRSFQTALSTTLGGVLIIALGLALFAEEFAPVVFCPLGLVVFVVGWRRFAALSQHKAGHRTVLLRFVGVSLAWIAVFLGAGFSLYHVLPWFTNLLSNALTDHPNISAMLVVVFEIIAGIAAIILILAASLGIAFAYDRVRRFLNTPD